MARRVGEDAVLVPLPLSARIGAAAHFERWQYWHRSSILTGHGCALPDPAADRSGGAAASVAVGGRALVEVGTGVRPCSTTTNVGVPGSAERPRDGDVAVD